MTKDYNTQLTPEEELAYRSWAQAGGKDPDREAFDYDLRGFFKQNPAPLGEGHLADTFKKPNHPTFSDQSKYHGIDGHEGGTWQQTGPESFNFTPGTTNMNTHGPLLQDYFQKFEPKSQLVMPDWMMQ